MNTRLERLFDKYGISEKDRYEISQFYGLLPDIKKQNLINNFEYLASKIKVIENDISIERDILMTNSLDKIRQTIEFVKKEKLGDKVKEEIDYLKNII
ncbi:MAG: hypothetical protein PHS49_06440 [Candidatus Gracilibacteria bacterium]|nr:hypothetical protein [Candidatus Gracilibacteria bacterium]